MMHIVIPFTRKNLIKELIKLYEPMNVILHPIQNENLEWGKEWIEPVLYTKEFIFDGCYEKVNYFKENCNIIDEDYYIVTGDDDALENNVPSEICKLDHDVICISLKRGDDVPIQGSNCGGGILEANPLNMKVWYTGLAQIIMKGKIFKQVKYKNDSHCADGHMAVYVKENFDVHYEPYLYARHNYYQPGRWERLGDKSFYEGI